MHKSIKICIEAYATRDVNSQEFQKIDATIWSAYSCSPEALEFYEERIYQIMKGITNNKILNECYFTFGQYKKQLGGYIMIYIYELKTSHLVMTIKLPNSEDRYAHITKYSETFPMVHRKIVVQNKIAATINLFP